jgi:CxxC-x17-CxxC domain-containing protein
MDDKYLECKDCGDDFVFSTGEQEYFMEKGFQDPGRCKPCRKKNKKRKMGSRQKQRYDIVCDECGEETNVPFKPSGDRPVYCRECYSRRG